MATIQIDVDTNPVYLQVSGAGLVQNLGPDLLFVAESSASNVAPSPTLTPDNGVRVQVGECVSCTTLNNFMWGVSEGASDIRVLTGGGSISGS